MVFDIGLIKNIVDYADNIYGHIGYDKESEQINEQEFEKIIQRKVS